MSILLSGGPLDGTRLNFANGDTIEFPPEQAPVLDFSVPTVDPFRPNNTLYRRSLKNPNIFVYQP